MDAKEVQSSQGACGGLFQRVCGIFRDRPREISSLTASTLSLEPEGIEGVWLVISDVVSVTV